MPQLEDPGREAFARAIALEQSPSSACQAGGYAVRERHAARHARRIASSARARARTEDLREEMRWGGTEDLAPVIDELARLALSVGARPKAALVTAARGLLAEVARLKQIMGPPREHWVPSPRKPPLSNREWLAKYAPPEYRPVEG